MFRVGLLVSLVILAYTSMSGTEGAKRSDDVSPLEAVVENLVQHVNANSADIMALRAKLEQAEKNVAFHVEFSRDPVHLGPNQRLVLDNVITNAGNGYDVSSGQFQAPVAGSYMFVVNFMGDIHTYNYVQVMLDGTMVDQSISHGDGSTWDHVSESLILHLNAGQKVWLKRGSETSDTKSIRGGHWTTFSGFLIRADQ